MAVLPERDGRIAWPGDGTLLAAWRHCEDELVREPTADEFARYRLVKSRLGATGLIPSRAAFIKAQEFASPAMLTQRVARRLLGGHVREADSAAAGLPVRGRVGAVKSARRDLEDLLSVFPVECRERLRGRLHREVLNEVVPPRRDHMGRALALSGAACRVLAATCLLQVSAERQSTSMAVLCLHLAERIDALVPGERQTDPAEVTAALDRCASEGPTRPMARSLYHYASRLARAELFLDQTLGCDAEGVKSMLPARHATWLAFTARMRRICAAAEKRTAEIKQARATDMYEALDAVVIASENRVVQLERIDLAITRVLEALDPADPAEAVPIASVGPVVRRDGSLGSGLQVVSFELRREHDLVTHARALDPRDQRTARMDYNLRCASTAGAHPGRRHLVYVGTRPVSTGGECVEPFFVDLYRCGVFDDGEGLTPEQRRSRAEVVRRADLPPLIVCSADFLRYTKRQMFVVRALRRAMGADAPVIIPFVALLHAAMIAQTIVRMGVRWGARLGATRQLRMGCFGKETLDGRERMFAMLRPKGWIADEKFEIDDDTLERVRRITLLAHDRWFPDEFDGARRAVPVVPFGDPTQRNAPDARYILVGSRGAIAAGDLSVFVRILLVGVVEASSHDYRKLFATDLGMQGVSVPQISALLQQTPGSASTAKYDVSDLVRRKRNGVGDPMGRRDATGRHGTW